MGITVLQERPAAVDFLVLEIILLKVLFLFLNNSMIFVILVSSTASSKTISGLLEFDSKTEAVEVLTVLNHYQIRIPSKSSSDVL